MSLFVKICGITREEDAMVAVQHGAAAIGFIFWPKSPRCIAPHRARAISDSLPAHVLRVGVFVDEEPEAVNRIAAAANLSAVQLHGDEDAACAGRIGVPVIKAVQITSDTDVRASAAWPLDIRLLVDAADRARRGGTGQLADWERARVLASVRPIILAGGLTPENIGEALRAVRPFGVDVSSGVEQEPGVKDHDRIRALFTAVTAARAQTEHRGSAGLEQGTGKDR